jgi:hypothetical protein
MKHKTFQFEAVQKEDFLMTLQDTQDDRVIALGNKALQVRKDNAGSVKNSGNGFMALFNHLKLMVLTNTAAALYIVCKY